MENDLVLELCSIAKPEYTKASGTKTCEMVEAWSDTQMETDTKGNFSTGSLMEKESILGQMVKCTKVSG